MVSFVTIIWSIAAGAALLLAIIYSFVSLNDRRARGGFAFSLASLGLAGTALFELAMMQAQTAQQWGALLRWAHVPVFLLIVGMAVFTRQYLRAGRTWLLAAIIGLRTALLVLDLLLRPNVNFEHIYAIGQVPLLGEPVTIATSAQTGRYQWMGLLSMILLSAFIADAMATLWRRGTAEARRVALVVGVPILLPVVLSLVLTQLVIWRVLDLPTLVVPPFFIALGAMAVEMSRQLIRGSILARELHESQQRLELAANAVGAGLWSWEPSTGHVWATERSWSMMGLAPTTEMRLVDVLRVVHSADVQELTAAVNAAPRNAGQRPLLFRVVKPDGTHRWIAAQGTAEPASHRKGVLVRGVLRDVTEQRRAEDEASELRRKLAQAGRITTLGQLSASLAHEISQPLSAIQQNCETAQLLVTRGSVNFTELRAIVDDIVRDNHRASEVVQRLRSWLRQGHMKVEPIVLETLAKDVLTVLRSEASVKQVTVECAVPSTLPLVSGDRVHLSQVLLNLVLNAIDASSHAGDIRHRVSIRASVVPAGGYCEVCVTDTGSGIEPDQLDKIFEPFVTTKQDGMGMGLSISRTIIEAHGGKLWADNEPQGGAIFRFTVPLHADELRIPA